MDARLMDVLWRSEVVRLPQEKWHLYQFIGDEEDSLAEEAVTAEEFRSLIIAQSSVGLGADHFHLSYDTIAKMLMEIEAELNRKMNVRCKKGKWIDFTDRPLQNTSNHEKKHLFLFIN